MVIVGRFIVTGDWHLRTTNPVKRVDDYFETNLKKLGQVYQIAKDKQADGIIVPGDLFHSPVINNKTLQFVYLMKTFGIPTYAVVGNHDVYSHNIDTLKDTALGLLVELGLVILVNETGIQPKGLTGINISGVHYYNGIDKDKSVYYKSILNTKHEEINIHIVHGMLVNDYVPFDHVSVNDIKDTDADVLITGHDHLGYGIKMVEETYDGEIRLHTGSNTAIMNCNQVMLNPGSLFRSSISEQKRQPKVYLLECGFDIVRKYKEFNIETTYLDVETPDKVFNQLLQDTKDEKEEGVNEFIELLSKGTVDMKMDIMEIINTVAVQDKIPDDVLQLVKDSIIEMGV